MIIHIYKMPCYKYQGWYFQYDRNKPLAPHPLNKDGELKKRVGDKFWNMLDEFVNLPIEEQEKYST